ncbi:MAG TPA: CBS domain-containing protein [Bdellovibrionales bacterium]|jgi:acetoin utilization protein AcuB|nr:CBS domain-containing protein [Bdellovibrionales bacterium]
MKAIPTIAKYMTTAPHTIGADQTLAKAEKFMSKYHIRHLPVLDGGELVGILSDRDVKLVESFNDVDPEKVSVEDAYTPDPFITSPNSPLSDVCAQMALHKYGCALVCDNKKLVGIFTWVDALNAFNELLSTRLKQ